MVANEENRASKILVRAEDENQDVPYTPAAQGVFSKFSPSLER